MHGDGIGRQPSADLPDKSVWQRSRTVEVIADDAERFLDLAGFVDGVLDPDDRERVAEWLALDPEAAGDVAAARALTGADHTTPAPESLVARAYALVGSGTPRRGNVIAFQPRFRPMLGLRLAAGWGSLVAAMVVVGWLGFRLGMDASVSVAGVGQPSDDGFLQEMVDPSAGFMRELNEGAPT